MRATDERVAAWVLGSRVPLHVYVWDRGDLPPVETAIEPAGAGHMPDKALEAALDVRVPMFIFSLQLKSDAEFRETCAAWTRNSQTLFTEPPADTEALTRLAKVLAVLAFGPDGAVFGGCGWKAARG